MSEADVDGYPRQVWWNADGETMVESYTITDMAHGTPLGIGDNDERYGAQGAFLIEAGISSSYHIANFFGLTEWDHGSGSRRPRKLSRKRSRNATKEAAKETARKRSSRCYSGAAECAPDLANVLWPLTTLNHRPEPARATAASRDRRRRASSPARSRPPAS